MSSQQRQWALWKWRINQKKNVTDNFATNRQCHWKLCWAARSISLYDKGHGTIQIPQTEKWSTCCFWIILTEGQPLQDFLFNGGTRVTCFTDTSIPACFPTLSLPQLTYFIHFPTNGGVDYRVVFSRLPVTQDIKPTLAVTVSSARVSSSGAAAGEGSLS